jgi:protein-S-isoprenylcysteine O-methyltransferase Ste14
MNDAGRQERVVPPPLLVLVALGGGWVAHRLRPVRFLPDLGLAGPAAGAALVLLGLGIGLAGVREFRRHRTPTSPYRPTTALVSSGIFRVTRNPMYLGFVLLTVGVAIAFNSASFLVSALLLVVVLQIAVIRPEERYLAKRYGADFEAYLRGTRRWI